MFNATDKLSFYARGTYYDNKTRRPQDATYYAKSKGQFVQKDAYTYNLKHETYTYGAGMKYMINRSAHIDAEFTRTISRRTICTSRNRAAICRATG